MGGFGGTGGVPATVGLKTKDRGPLGSTEPVTVEGRGGGKLVEGDTAGPVIEAYDGGGP